MAYKALKAARGVPGGRDATRMMQKMGMKVDAIPDVSEVIIRTPSREIVIDAPAVTIVTVQGQTMYQIAGGDHHHLVCRVCGNGMEVEHKILKNLYQDLESASGYRLINSHVTFFGLCPDCQMTNSN